MILDTMDSLLECALEALADNDVPVCKWFLNPGDNAPHDVCSSQMSDGVLTDGQLWVAHLGTTSGWPAPTGLPTVCTTPWTDLIEIGITRCAQGKITDQGAAPSGDIITTDAQNQERDRYLIRQAMMCCMTADGRDIVVQGWDPIPPLGGCVGGVWSFYLRDDGCSCGDLES